MNDTHRSTPAFASFIAASRDAFRMPALPERVGELTGEVRDRLNTQTTDQNSVASGKSVADVLRELHAERNAIDHTGAPWGFASCYIEALEDVAERLGLTGKAGKSGDGAAIEQNAGDHAPEAANSAVRAFKPVDQFAGGYAFGSPEPSHKPHVPAFDGLGTVGDAREAAHYAAAGKLKEEGEDEPDRTPEQQAATFQAITEAPRPTAAQIKETLEALEYHERCWRNAGQMAWSNDAHLAGQRIDSLGIHCLALEIERDDLAGQLDRIAAQAKPVDGTDLAELVQKAREASGYIGRGGLWHGSSGTMHGRSIGGAETANMIDRLVAAVNDQARRLRDAETVQDPDGLIDESYRAVSELIRHNTDPGTSAWSNLVSRMRWALVQQGKPPRTYTDDQRDQAIAKFANDPAAQWYTEERSARIVDLVAEALGMTRAK